MCLTSHQAAIRATAWVFSWCSSRNLSKPAQDVPVQREWFHFSTPHPNETDFDALGIESSLTCPGNRSLKCCSETLVPKRKKKRKDFRHAEANSEYFTSFAAREVGTG